MFEAFEREPEHGTYARAQRHRKAGEKPCEPCREAYNAYMREFRRRNPRPAEEMALRGSVRRAAVVELISLHREQFYKLYLSRLEEAGLTYGRKQK